MGCLMGFILRRVVLFFFPFVFLGVEGGGYKSWGMLSGWARGGKVNGGKVNGGKES